MKSFLTIFNLFAFTALAQTLPPTLDGREFDKFFLDALGKTSVRVAISDSGAAPAGTATSGNQLLEIIALNSIDSKIQNPMPVTGTFWQATQPVSGTFWQATQPVSIATMPTTPVTGTFWQATQPVSGPLTNGELRASAVPVSIAVMPTTPVTGTFWQATQPISAIALPLPAGAATLTGQNNIDNDVLAFKTSNHVDFSALDGDLLAFKSANHVDLTAIQSILGTPMQQTGGSLTCNSGSNLNTSALNLEATQSAFKTANHADQVQIDTDLLAFKSANHTDLGLLATATVQSTISTRIGDVVETAPASDTASSGLNGRLQRIAQRLTTEIGTVSTETTLAGFKTANHTDLGTLDTDLLALKTANHSDLIATEPRNISQFGGSAIVTGAGASGAGIPRVTVSNDSSVRILDGSGNAITSQASSAQRALDVGVNVAGVQIDPRTKTIRLTQPTVGVDAAQGIPVINDYGMAFVSQQAAGLTQWGKSFSATTNFVSTGTTAQTALMLIRNPNGSGVNCKLRKALFTGAGGTFRIYAGPTITANGTAVTSSGNRQTGQAAAACLVTTLPTISANGTVFKSFSDAAQANLMEDFAYSRWIEPNNAMLVTIAQVANATPGSIDIEWAEQ